MVAPPCKAPTGLNRVEFTVELRKENDRESPCLAVGLQEGLNTSDWLIVEKPPTTA